MGLLESLPPVYPDFVGALPLEHWTGLDFC
jgi:hypothetical protein